MILHAHTQTLQILLVKKQAEKQTSRAIFASSVLFPFPLECLLRHTCCWFIFQILNDDSCLVPAVPEMKADALDHMV